MARGLSSDEARALILKGLVASVVSDERIATRVDDMLVSR
jgi:Fe-S cluster assembly scaffold protein SufB